jgi:metal-responsive CopG/Arc/MetJ family transcriptional regulator
MEKGSRRVKLTVSLSSDLVKRIEKRRKKGVSRSEMFEQMLTEGDRAARQRELEEEVRAYYAAGDPEGDAISQSYAKMVKKLRIDDDPPAAKKRK